MSYINSQHTSVSKPLGLNNAPTDARSYFYDAVNFVYRPYVTTAEVLAYLTTSANRKGNFPVYINLTGVLSNTGVITGGAITEYWFKDGVADNNLVVKEEGSTVDLSDYPTNEQLAADLANYLPVPDGLVSTGGITETGNVVTIAQPVKWRVGGVNYVAVSNQVFTIAAVDEGNFRKDIIIGKSDGTTQLVQGTENAAIAVQPGLPANSVLLTVVDLDSAGTSSNPPSATQDLSGYEQFTFDNTTPITDFDTLLNAQGSFDLTTANCPFPGDFGYGLSKRGNNWHHQWAWSNNPDGGYYKRGNINGGGWSAWVRYQTAADVTAAITAALVPVNEEISALAGNDYSLVFLNPCVYFIDYFHYARQIKTVFLKLDVATYQYSMDGGNTYTTPTLPLTANIAVPADTLVYHKITRTPGATDAVVYIELA